MSISRVRTVRRADRLIRLGGRIALVLVALFLVYWLGNLVYYLATKSEAQHAAAATVDVALPALPDGAEAWRPATTLPGSAWPDYQQALLDFRAREVDYIALKLQGRRFEGSPPGELRGLALLVAAGRREPAPLDLAQERQLRGHDLHDCTIVLRHNAQRLVNRASAEHTTDDEAAAALAEAEEMLRAYYAAGHFLASRRYVLENIAEGYAMMIESLELLFAFYNDRQRAGEAVAVDALRTALLPRAEQVRALLDRRDDDDLEVWVRMTAESESPAVRLQGAYRLADAGRMWWRIGESVRAARVLGRALLDPRNDPIREALYDVVTAMEANADLPSLIEGLRTSAPRVIRNRLDELF